MRRIATISLWIQTLGCLAFAALEINGGRVHLSEDWPAHAKFHAITGIFCELLLCALAIIFGWKYLHKQGHQWAWATTAAIGVVMFGGLVIADPLTHGGLSGGGEALGNAEFFHHAADVGAITWIITSIMTRTFVRSPGSPTVE